MASQKALLREIIACALSALEGEKELEHEEVRQITKLLDKQKGEKTYSVLTLCKDDFYLTLDLKRGKDKNFDAFIDSISDGDMDLLANRLGGMLLDNTWHEFLGDWIKSKYSIETPYCLDCGREIHHKGRCLACYASYKSKQKGVQK